jgi:hypothetical protein
MNNPPLIEAINELTVEKVMLNQNQTRRLEAIARWLREIRDSAEFKQLEYSPDVTLADAIQAVGELLQEQDHCDYNPSNFTDEEWHKYLEQRPVMHIRRVIPWREKISSFILDAAIKGALYKAFTDLGILLDTNNDGKITIEDVELKLIGNSYDFQAALGGKFDFETDFATDFGLPNLGLSVEAQKVSVGVDYRFDLGFGIEQNNNQTPQFYFNTSSNKEISLNLNAGVDMLQARGKLGFLELDVEDKNAANELAIELAIDLQDNDNKLHLNELPIIDANFDGKADIQLGFKTSFNGSEKLPSLLSDFNLLWEFDGTDLDGNTPNIAFNNVRLDMGTFFSNFVDPIFKNIQEITKPIEPIAKFLTRPIQGVESFIEAIYLDKCAFTPWMTKL